LQKKKCYDREIHIENTHVFTGTKACHEEEEVRVYREVGELVLHEEEVPDHHEVEEVLACHEVQERG